MPKRKTADVTAEAPTAAEPRKKASTAKPKTAAATHKRTPAPRTQVIAEAAAVAAEPVAIDPIKPVTPTVTREQIAVLAYSYWEARGFQPGSQEEDWLRAERALTLTA